MEDTNIGIISRFADIMEANINALLDKCEDPSKMIDQALRKCNEEIAAKLGRTTRGICRSLTCAMNKKVKEKNVSRGK